MKYSTVNQSEAQRARDYLDLLIERKKLVEIKAVSKRRTLNQNSYLHVLIGAFSQHFGYTAAEGKIIYKELNKDIYAYTKNGRTFYRSSADISTEDMARSIDRFREASAAQDYPLPAATDEAWIRELDNLIEQSKHYL